MSKPVPMSLPPRQPAKGEAIASVASIEALAPAEVQVADPQPVSVQELPQPTPSRPKPRPAATAPVVQPAPEFISPPPLPPNVKALGGTIAVTVRMDQPTYERLKMYGVRTRQTNQDIVLNAIKATLDALA